MFQDCLVAHYWADVVFFCKALCVLGFVGFPLLFAYIIEVSKERKYFIWGLWIFCILFFIFIPNRSVILSGCPRGFF